VQWHPEWQAASNPVFGAPVRKPSASPARRFETATGCRIKILTDRCGSGVEHVLYQTRMFRGKRKIRIGCRSRNRVRNAPDNSGDLCWTRANSHSAISKTGSTKRHVTEIECLVPDLTGVARGKILPREKFTEDRGMRCPRPSSAWA